MPQGLNSPKGFCKALLKTRGGRGVVGSVISLCAILFLDDGEIAGWCHRS